MPSSLIKVLPKKTRLPVALGTISACAILHAGDARAVLVYELIEQGSDVRVQLSGKLTNIASAISGSQVVTNNNRLRPTIGELTIGTGGLKDKYTISGPISFGSDVLAAISTDPSTIPNYFTSLRGTGSFFLLDQFYSSGSAIFGSGLMTGKTLSSLGLSSTSGLLGTWSIGGDSIELWAGAKPAANPVPGPLPLLGVGAAFACSRRLRTRLRGSRHSKAA